MNTKTKRPTIGLLADNLFDSFEGPIWSYAAETAKAMDVNLFIYSGGSLTNWYNINVFNLVNTGLLDAIISISGSIGRGPDENLVKFHQKFKPLPVVTISRPVEGCCNLLIDNESGMTKIIEHMIEFHGYRKIAFISGPEGNVDAKIRYDVYRRSLQKYAIEYDPNLVYFGSFQWSSGSRAVKEFLDERHVQFDAIVAANDSMALYAMKELQRRGFDVPKQIGISGFDNIIEGQNSFPLLTTVKLPRHRLGSEAVRLALDLIHGGEIGNHYIQTQPVIRESCGCNSLPGKSVAINNENIRKSKEAFFNHQESIRKQLIREIHENIPVIGDAFGSDDWSAKLIDALFEELDQCNGEFYQVLLELLKKGYTNKNETRLSIRIWYNLFELIEGMLGSAIKDEIIRSKFKMIISTSIKQIGTTLEDLQIARQAAFDGQYYALLRLYQDITNSNDFEFVKIRIAEEFPSLKIKSIFLSRYENDTFDKASLIFNFSFSKHFEIDSSIELFPVRQLIPGTISFSEIAFTIVVLPIFRIGFALYEIDNMESNHYPFLGQITTAIKIMTMINQIHSYANDLERQITSRTEELKNAQQKLIEIAHQAGMAEISIGVLHNIGNLLNSINVSSEEIQTVLSRSKIDHLGKVCEMISSYSNDQDFFSSNDSKAALIPEYLEKINTTLQSDFRKIDDETKHLIGKINMIVEIIRTLQDYAKKDSMINFNEKTSLPMMIDNALKIHESLLLKNNIHVTKEYFCCDQININSNKLTHVFINLIKNSVEAMIAIPPDKRCLKISTRTYLDNKIKIIVSDTGIGIPKENIPKMFTYGFTTKRDGHGFGLHTCANYINEIGGSITISSDGTGSGATFTIIIEKK